MSRSKKIVHACRMAFHGYMGQEIAKKLEVDDSTISRWKKTDIWKYTEQVLVAREIQAIEKGEARAFEHLSANVPRNL